jgi:hypothetical protein
MAAGDANHPEVCPFETEASPGFHAYLPDCRAYELVTPTYAAGQIPYGWDRELPPISSDGNHIISLDYAGFAETENEEEEFGVYGAVYEFSRTATGWSAESLEPPASLAPRREFDFASANLSKTLWGLQLPPKSGEELPIVPEDGISNLNNEILEVREAAGGGKGRFAVVGPVAAPGHEAVNFALGHGQSFLVVGASADLTHVVFSVWADAKQLWPGDTTVEGDESLYEYRGTGDSEPVLVGVSNDGPLEGDPVNAHAKLISRCGAALASLDGGTGLNAISASGGVVFFAAQACEEEPSVDELYARVNGEKTVAISEPPLSGPESIPGRECTATCAADETTLVDRKPATFLGASSDGTKVFFTSEQPLVDGATAGGAYLYEETIAQEGIGSHVTSLTLIASATPNVTAISNDGTRLYFESSDVLTLDANGNGEVAEPGHSNLYVDGTETGVIAFVGQEASAFDETTASGQYLVFESARQFANTNDTSPVGQIFEYDAGTGTIDRVSVGQFSAAGYECQATKTVEDGYNCDGNTSNGSYSALLPAPPRHRNYEPPTAQTAGLAIAEDGTVVFMSRDALTPNAVESAENIYEYRAGNVYLISPGDEAIPIQWNIVSFENSRLLGISESSESVFFSTTEQLLPQDTDTQSSWYDARQEGGFPAPATQVGCAADACRDPLGTAPQLPGIAGSATTAGGEDFAPPTTTVIPRRAVKCRKAEVRKNDKCVKRKQPKSGKPKRATAKGAADRRGRS